MGIEALSRGAAFVRFSDSNRAPIETIRSNVEHCGFKSQAETRRGDAFTFLASAPDKAFEYIYIAPPQYQDMWIKALELVDGLDVPTVRHEWSRRAQWARSRASFRARFA